MFRMLALVFVVCSSARLTWRRVRQHIGLRLSALVLWSLLGVSGPSSHFNSNHNLCFELNQLLITELLCLTSNHPSSVCLFFHFVILGWRAKSNYLWWSDLWHAGRPPPPSPCPGLRSLHWGALSERLGSPGPCCYPGAPVQHTHTHTQTSS